MGSITHMSAAPDVIIDAREDAVETASAAVVRNVKNMANDIHDQCVHCGFPVDSGEKYCNRPICVGQN